MNTTALVEFGRIGFLNMLAFRLRYYTGIITYFINVTVYYFIWRAIYTVQPEYGGLDFTGMVTYVSIGWIIRSLYFNNVDRQMSDDIIQGKISMMMLKPVSVQWSYIARALGESAFRVVMLTVPACVVISLIYPVEPPASAAHFAAFLVAVAASILLVAAINFIVGSCAVHLKSIFGLLRAKYWMQELLSGLLVPITLFPSPLREISGWLPFQHIGFTPLMIYLGEMTWPEIGRAFLLEWFWVVALLGFGSWLWSRLSRKITIHGG